MGLLISVGGLMYVNGIRSLSEIKRGILASYFNCTVGKGEEHSTKNAQMKDFIEAKEFIDDAMKTLEGDWNAVIVSGAIGIVTALYLIWDPLNDLAFNNFLLVISVVCMAVQFAAFYVLARRASITMKH
jgi:hypothetical protein